MFSQEVAHPEDEFDQMEKAVAEFCETLRAESNDDSERNAGHSQPEPETLRSD